MSSENLEIFRITVITLFSLQSNGQMGEVARERRERGHKGVVDGERILVQPLRPFPSQIHSCNKSSDISVWELSLPEKNSKAGNEETGKTDFFPLECVFVGLLKTTENMQQHDHTPLGSLYFIQILLNLF